jgi:NADPH2:quinone reductase
MGTRALFDVDPIQQHYILNHAAQLVDSGLIQLPSVEVLPYSLENLKKLHEQQESGKMIGKAVLEMS